MAGIGKLAKAAVAVFKKGGSVSGRKAITQKFGKEASRFVSRQEMSPEAAETLGQTVKKTTEEAIGQAYSAGTRRGAVIAGGIGAVTTIGAAAYGIHETMRANDAEAQAQAQNAQISTLNEQLEAEKAELEKTKKELEKAQKELEEAQAAQEAEQSEESEEEPKEYTVKKGDCFWNIAKDFLINEVHKGETDYVPTDKEIYNLAMKFMEDNGYKLADDNYHSAPVLKPDTKLNLAA